MGTGSHRMRSMVKYDHSGCDEVIKEKYAETEL